MNLAYTEYCRGARYFLHYCNKSLSYGYLKFIFLTENCKQSKGSTIFPLATRLHLAVKSVILYQPASFVENKNTSIIIFLLFKESQRFAYFYCELLFYD